MFKDKLYGIIVCLIIAIPALIAGNMFPIIGGPIIAIILGMIIAVFWKRRENFDEGISFTSKYVLQAAVVLLGFGLNLNVILATGIQSLPIIVGTIAGSIEPQRVPMMIPSSGVRPRVVSRHLPSLTAEIEEPLPRWQMMILASFLPRILI